jgi:hypothetical protein
VSVTAIVITIASTAYLQLIAHVLLQSPHTAHHHTQQPAVKPADVTDDSSSGSSDGSDDDTEGIASAGAEVLGGETGSGDSHVQVKHLTTCVVVYVSVQCSACVHTYTYTYTVCHCCLSWLVAQLAPVPVICVVICAHVTHTHALLCCDSANRHTLVNV